jgi:peptidoglycan hydrolase-like protein with peptidoglycan-binding domain
MAAGTSLKLGSSGSEVTVLQERLLALGYLDYSGTTGYYGTLTKTAVIRFQQNNGLTADGIAGPKTQAALYASGVKSMVLRVGSSGEAVKALQLRLKALGYFSGTGTGYYGSVTRTAVISFQQACGLSADGVAGPITHNKAFSNNACTASAASASAPAASSASTDAIADIALAQLGKGYALGTQGPTTYDCSGLAYYAATQAGFSATRMSAAAYFTYSSWESISGLSNLQKGDLIFFRSETSSYISHMGIYTGNGQFVHASSGQAKVMVSTLSGYWTNLYMGARRVS